MLYLDLLYLRGQKNGIRNIQKFISKRQTARNWKIILSNCSVPRTNSRVPWPSYTRLDKKSGYLKHFGISNKVFVSHRRFSLVMSNYRQEFECSNVLIQTLCNILLPDLAHWIGSKLLSFWEQNKLYTKS